LLKQGLAPKAIIDKILAEDPDTRQGWPKAGRQFAVFNAKGELAAYSGPRAPKEFGDAQGKFCTAQGNTLGRPGVKGEPPDPKRASCLRRWLKALKRARSRPTAGGIICPRAWSPRSKRDRRPEAITAATVRRAHCRQEGLRRLVAAQRRRAAVAGRRQSGTDRGTAPAGGKGDSRRDSCPA
jgi:hypothetical protein